MSDFPDERALEIAVLRLNAELYERQTDIQKGRAPRPVEVDPSARLREAVRELALYHGSIVHLLADLDQEEDGLNEPDHRMRWITRTFDDVRTGDRIRFRGTEAVVETAYRRGWHVHPASKYNVIPLEHDDVALRRVGNPKLYVLKPDLEADIHLTEDEITALDSMGWDNRVCVITEKMQELLS